MQRAILALMAGEPGRRWKHLDLRKAGEFDPRNFNRLLRILEHRGLLVRHERPAGWEITEAALAQLVMQADSGQAEAE